MAAAEFGITAIKKDVKTDEDILFDEIGSALKVKQILRERAELFEALEMYYRVFIMGDTSGNIPGVPSVGEKTATKIITEYGSIENAYAHVQEIKPPRAIAPRPIQNPMFELSPVCGISGTGIFSFVMAALII